MTESSQKLTREERNQQTKARNATRREKIAEKVIERNRVRCRLSPTQQLAELDKRLGKDVGAERERARLWDKVYDQSPSLTISEKEVDSIIKGIVKSR